MMSAIERAYSNYLGARERQSLLRQLVSVERPNAREIIVDDKRFLNVSSNDYLGLSHNGKILARAQEWMAESGAGSSASRLVTGNLEHFSRLQAKLASFKGKAAALVLASGFQANATVLEALFDQKVLGAQPLVFSDKLNHASMHFGCKAAGIRQIRYRHCDVGHLRDLLEKETDSIAPRFILTESVFSMDGDRAPLDEISALAKAHDAVLIVDDAHAAGVLGKHGCGLGGKADIVIGTFSKAFGSFGAYVASSKAIHDYLVNRCAGLIYSTALPPPVLGAIDAALDLVPAMDEERVHVLALAEQFREGAKALGFETGASDTQIVPLIVHEAETAQALSAFFKENGIWAVAIRPPTVPEGTARLRFAFSAAHEAQDVEMLLDVLSRFKTNSEPKAATQA